MENQQTYELIEKYIAGTLSPDELRQTQLRLESDPGFRAELELHLQLQLELENPEKQRLRAVMQNIVQEEPMPRSGGNIFFKILIFSALTLLGGWAVWHWASPAPDALPRMEAEPNTPDAPTLPEKSKDASPETPSSPAAEKSSVPVLPKENKGSPKNSPPDTVQKNIIKPPIARREGPEFAPDPTFERRLGSSVRSSGDISIELQKPKSGASFSPQKGEVRLRFQGKITDVPKLGFNDKLSIQFFRSGQPSVLVLEKEYSLTFKHANWQHSFDFWLRLPFEPGLYYFVVTLKEAGEPVQVGKFTVRA